MSSRLFWADQAKALAIILMVLCHYGLSNPNAVTFIYIFHMPIFFFISGYFDKGNIFNAELLLKNFKTLMIPYFFFSVCAFSICWISPYIHPELYNNDGLPKTFLKAFLGMFLMQDNVRSYAFMPLGPLWFLVALFEVRIFFALIVGVVRSNKFCIFVSLLVSVPLILGYRYKYFSIDAAVMALPIYALGYIVKRNNLIEMVTNKCQSFSLFILGILYLVFIGMKNGKVCMDGANFGNSIWLFYVNAIIGSITVIFFFRAIDIKWNWLSIVGISTLTILGTHFYVGIMGKVFATKVGLMDSGNMPIVFVILLTVFGILLGVYMNKFLIRYMPFAIGKDKV